MKINLSSLILVFCLAACSSASQDIEITNENDVENLYSSPVTQREKPENTDSQTITIIRGKPITFEVSATDSDGNLNGIEWRQSGVSNPEVEYVTETDSLVFKKIIVYNTLGTHEVTGIPFDADNAYGEKVTWHINVVEKIRTLYVARVDAIIGSTPLEDHLIAFSKKNNITRLLGYRIANLINDGRSAEVNAFIGKAKSNGITEIFIPIAGGAILPRLYEYYDDPNYPNKFDGIITEIEFWGGNGDRATKYNDFMTVLTAMKNGSVDRGDKIRTGVYLGTVETRDDGVNEADGIAELADLVLLHYYSSNVTDIYNYRKERFQFILDSEKAAGLEVSILYSYEQKSLGAQNNFFNINTTSLDQADDAFFNAYSTDESLTNKYKVAITGTSYFIYKWLIPNEDTHAPIQVGLQTPRKETINAGVTRDLFAKVTKVRAIDADVVRADWYMNDVLAYSDVAPAPDGLNYTFNRTFTFNTPGTYRIKAVFVNDAGNESIYHLENTYIVR